MLNILWPVLIIVSYIYAIFSGNIDKVNTAIFDYTKNAVDLTITLVRYNVLVEWFNGNCSKYKLDL